MTKKKTARKAVAPAESEDPRDPVEADSAGLAATLTALEAVLGTLTPPAEPHAADLVHAFMHFTLGEGVACGLAQEGLRRILDSCVDLNEFRVTEAYETERLLEDLAIPDLYERCRILQSAVGEIYNDQNAVNLAFLREAAITDRKNFFARVPSIGPKLARALGQLMNWEDAVLSSRANQRTQNRIGFDPKDEAQNGFLDKVRELLLPFGHIPLQVGRDTPSKKAIVDPALCPTCLLLRLGPAGARR